MNPLGDAIDGLLVVFAGLAQLVDGPTTDNATGDVIAVGVGVQDIPEIGTQTRFSDMGGGHRVVFEVPCLARSWSGDNSVKVQRDRTLALLSAAQVRVEGDPQLSGRVSFARWAGASYLPRRTDQAQLVVDAPFRVEITVL